MTSSEACKVLLRERVDVIRRTIEKYGEKYFYVSYSGGRDSCVVDKLLDLAIDNNIPRVYADTGIELNLVRQFVYDKAKTDDRINIVTPKVNIVKMLEQEGYPFKSKEHSRILNEYQTKGMTDVVNRYVTKQSKSVYCPKSLLYQFTDDFNLKISDKCCDRLKKQPLKEWALNHGKSISILGLMQDEKGRRVNTKCMTYIRGKLKHFSPLAVVSKEWEDWFIQEYDVKLPLVYYPPYNYTRTGCKGCPFNLTLHADLITLRKYFPKEEDQCEFIWKPIYDEYRRINYRLDSTYTKEKGD